MNNTNNGVKNQKVALVEKANCFSISNKMERTRPILSPYWQQYGDVGQRKSIPPKPRNSHLIRGFKRGLCGYFSTCFMPPILKLLFGSNISFLILNFGLCTAIKALFSTLAEVLWVIRQLGVFSPT